MKHPFDEILEDPSTQSEPLVNRRSALNTVLATGIGMAGMSSLQAQDATTMAIGEEGGKGGNPGPPPIDETVLTTRTLEDAYAYFRKVVKERGKSKKVLKFGEDLEKIASYEIHRCKRQLEDDRFDKLEPLVSLLSIKKLSELKAAGEAEKLVLKYTDHPKYDEAMEMTTPPSADRPLTEAKGEDGQIKVPPGPVRITTLALGEEGGAKR